MRVSQPDPAVLIITKGRLSAFAGLAVGVGLLVVVYYALLGPGGGPVADGSFGWLLLLFPILLIPQFSESFRVFAHGGELTFDGRSSEIRRNRRSVAAFNEIRHLCLQATNGSCEELTLSAVLTDGRKFEIHTGERAAAMNVLARDVARVLDVEVVRNE